MSLSSERTRSILTYFAAGQVRPTSNRTASSSPQRGHRRDKSQSKIGAPVEERPYPSYKSMKTKADESKSHRRHKSSRPVDLRASYRNDKSYQPEPKHERKSSYFDDSDSDSHKEESLFSRAVSFLDEKRSSYTSQTEQTPVEPKSPFELPPHREPTVADVNKHHIAPGRCLKHWDPDEEPILLLTAVFDANSLGKWVLDQTLRIYGEDDEMTDFAAQFWYEHIQLGGKIKHAKSRLPHIKDPKVVQKIKKCTTFGDKLVNELGEILKTCEQRVLEVTGTSEIPKLGHKSVVVFIDTFIGRNATQRDAFHDLTHRIKAWNDWFDTNFERLL